MPSLLRVKAVMRMTGVGASGYVLKETLPELRHWLERESEALTLIHLPMAEKGKTP